MNQYLPLSVVILTKNEEQDLPGCLDELTSISDDVYVVDSNSTDSTVEIAKQRGVPVFSHSFTGFGDQRNWAIDNLPHKYTWVMHLDADERLTPEFVTELAEVVEGNPVEAGFFVPSKLMFGTSWLRYSSGYPVYQVRLFHRDRLRFQNSGHGQRELTSGILGYLREPYLHFAFSKGLVPWFEKHVRYAAAEALECKQMTSTFFSDLRETIYLKGVERRRAAKRLSYRIPFRGLLRFLYLFIFMRGVLDGKAGFIYARMMAIYESIAGVMLFANDLKPSTLEAKNHQ